MVEKNLIVTLKAKVEEFDFSKLRAGKDNALANSGKTTYGDLHRMNFVINGKKIDTSFIIALKEGAKDYKSELFSRDDIYNLENSKERAIDTDQGKAFVDSVLKELNQSRLPEIWDSHCKDDETTNYQKTDIYKKEFERFYNIGQKYNHLLPKEENGNYRPIVKEIFKEMFKYAGAEVPSDSILKELVTNCNQAGYESTLYMDVVATLTQHSCMPGSPKREMNIDCTSQNGVRIRSDSKMPIYKLKMDNKLDGKAFDLPSSLEFTLKSQDNKGNVTYNDCKLSLTAPRELENYHANKEKQLQLGDMAKRSILDIIIESFLILIEKFTGTKLKNKQGIYNEIKNTLNQRSSSEAIVIKDTGFSPIKIECSLREPLKVDSQLESIESPIHCNGYTHGSRGL